MTAHVFLSAGPSPSRSRRRALVLLALAPAAALWRPVATAAPAPPVTPADDIGPFYPPDWQGEIDADLTRWQGRQARGERLQLDGTVVDRHGQPLAGAFVEIWQADAGGRYRFPGLPEAPRDGGFQGYGRAETDAAGRYAFRTIVPGRYGTRPPHIHLRLIRPGRAEFITQIYFRGMNAEGGPDGWKPPQREALSVDLVPAPGGGQAARFDVVLAG